MTATRQPGNVRSTKKFREAEIRTVEKAIRRIVRAHDLQSKALAKASGLTAAQLVLTKGIAELGEVTSTALSTYADISTATVVTVLDNLEERGLIQRYRSDNDRRIVHTKLTESGEAIVAAAPPPLGAMFLERFKALDADDRQAMVQAIIRLAGLMSRDSDAPAPAGSDRLT